MWQNVCEAGKVKAHQPLGEGRTIKRTAIKPGLQLRHSESFEKYKVNKPYTPILLLPTQPLEVTLLLEFICD